MSGGSLHGGSHFQFEAAALAAARTDRGSKGSRNEGSVHSESGRSLLTAALISSGSMDLGASPRVLSPNMSNSGTPTASQPAPVAEAQSSGEMGRVATPPARPGWVRDVPAEDQRAAATADATLGSRLRIVPIASTDASRRATFSGQSSVGAGAADRQDSAGEPPSLVRQLSSARASSAVSRDSGLFTHAEAHVSEEATGFGGFVQRGRKEGREGGRGDQESPEGPVHDLASRGAEGTGEEGPPPLRSNSGLSSLLRTTNHSDEDSPSRPSSRAALRHTISIKSATLRTAPLSTGRISEAHSQTQGRSRLSSTDLEVESVGVPDSTKTTSESGSRPGSALFSMGRGDSRSPSQKNIVVHRSSLGPLGLLTSGLVSDQPMGDGDAPQTPEAGAGGGGHRGASQQSTLSPCGNKSESEDGDEEQEPLRASTDQSHSRVVAWLASWSNAAIERVGDVVWSALTRSAHHVRLGGWLKAHVVLTVAAVVVPDMMYVSGHRLVGTRGAAMGGLAVIAALVVFWLADTVLSLWSVSGQAFKWSAERLYATPTMMHADIVAFTGLLCLALGTWYRAEWDPNPRFCVGVCSARSLAIPAGFLPSCARLLHALGTLTALHCTPIARRMFDLRLMRDPELQDRLHPKRLASRVILALLLVEVGVMAGMHLATAVFVVPGHAAVGMGAARDALGQLLLKASGAALVVLSLWAAWSILRGILQERYLDLQRKVQMASTLVERLAWVAADEGGVLQHSHHSSNRSIRLSMLSHSSMMGLGPVSEVDPAPAFAPFGAARFNDVGAGGVTGTSPVNRYVAKGRVLARVSDSMPASTAGPEPGIARPASQPGGSAGPPSAGTSVAAFRQRMASQGNGIPSPSSQHTATPSEPLPSSSGSDGFVPPNGESPGIEFTMSRLVSTLHRLVRGRNVHMGSYTAQRPSAISLGSQPSMVQSQTYQAWVDAYAPEMLPFVSELGTPRSKFLSMAMQPQTGSGGLQAQASFNLGTSPQPFSFTPPARGRPSNSGTQSVPRALHSIHEVDFARLRRYEWDPIALEADPAALRLHVMAMFHDLGLFDSGIVAVEPLWELVGKLSQLYAADNPYHNWTHAVDVTHSLYIYLTQTTLGRILEPLDKFAIMVAAMTHDVGHKGVSNTFLKESNHDLAITYNDSAIQENMHLAVFYKLIMKKPQCNVFASLSKTQQLYCRKLIIEAVLSTDMAQHFDLVGDLTLLVEEIESQVEREAEPGGDALGEMSGSDGEDAACADTVAAQQHGELEPPPGIPSGRGTALWRSMQDVDNKFLLLSSLLHIADVGAQMKPPDVARLWGERVMTEFFRQGDQESEMGLTVTAMCDKTRVVVPDSQMSFMEAILQPLLRTMLKVTPEMVTLVSNLRRTYSMWSQDLLAYIKGNAQLSEDERARQIKAAVDREALFKSNCEEILKTSVARSQEQQATPTPCM